ncbi:MAG: von Willebrand factor type A domain-containing protein [Candidatus Ornithomonoglobus sp.]
MKIRTTIAGIALSFVVPVCAAAAEKTEYTGAVDFVLSNDIMDRGADLRLGDKVTRCELVKMLMTAADCDALDSAIPVWLRNCQGMPETHWAYEYAEQAAKIDLAAGMNYTVDYLSYPDNEVSLAEAVKMTLTACGIVGHGYNAPETYIFPGGFTSEAVMCGVLDVSELDDEILDSHITRGKAAELIYKAYKSVQNGKMSFECCEFYTDGDGIRKTGYGLFSQELSVKNADLSGDVTWGRKEEDGTYHPYGYYSCIYTGTKYFPTIQPKLIYNQFESEEEYKEYAKEYAPDTFSSAENVSHISFRTGTAAAENLRHYIKAGFVPYYIEYGINRGVLWSEELINYYRYTSPEIENGKSFGMNAEITECPWSENKLARFTIEGENAENVKVSVVFNPDAVSEYRYIGYEDASGVFADAADTYAPIEGGEQRTAVYELIMKDNSAAEDAFTVNISYNRPGEAAAMNEEFKVENKVMKADADTCFAAAAAMLGLMHNRFIDVTYDDVAKLAAKGAGDDEEKQDFVRLVSIVK